MYRTLVIDDEAPARQRVLHLLGRWPQILVVAECRSGTEAIAAIHQHRPDLIFLDIQMRDMSGFDVLFQLKEEEQPLIIFVTAHSQYALRAFEVFAFDYLLKPLREDRFERSVNKALEELGKRIHYTIPDSIQKKNSRQKAPSTLTHDSFLTLPVKQNGKITLLWQSQIICIIAAGYYVEIHTYEKKYLLRESLKALAGKLEPSVFVRIHRSTIINLSSLEEIIPGSPGCAEVHLKNGEIFSVSKSYRTALFDLLGI